MVSTRVPGMCGWGNSSSQLPGVLGSSPYHRSGLRAPFFWENRVVTTVPRPYGRGTTTARYAKNQGQCEAA